MILSHQVLLILVNNDYELATARMLICPFFLAQSYLHHSLPFFVLFQPNQSIGKEKIKIKIWIFVAAAIYF